VQVPHKWAELGLSNNFWKFKFWINLLLSSSNRCLQISF